MEVLHIPSGGVTINGIAYVAAGAGPHPTIVICHGWPGNEKNLDLAQGLRRAGWNAVTFNYRGSWGSPGEFHFAQVPEDTAAALAYLRTPEVAQKIGIDPQRIALAGHSMGGWSAAMTGAQDSALIGVALMAPANMGGIGAMARDDLVKLAADNAETLVTSPERMADELSANVEAFSLQGTAQGLAKLPLLVLTADDGLAPAANTLVDAIRATPGSNVQLKHFATDHGWSDRRLELQSTLIQWLSDLPKK